MAPPANNRDVEPPQSVVGEHSVRVEESLEEVAGVPVFWREGRPAGGRAPTLYLHGVPTHGEDWLPFLGRTGGIAPDLPGFGRSGKPARFDYSIPGYRRFVSAFLDHLGVERLSLVVHDWGAVGLAFAQEAPERIERLVVINSVPFLPGYEWHRLARIWRRRVAGELAMGFTTRRTLRLFSRGARKAPGPMPEALVESVWRHFDHGTQRAILHLYRSAPPHVLEAEGARLGEITSPALVLWGDQDPYVPSSFATTYAERLGGPVRLETVPAAGHWPWIDRPETIDTVVRFLLDEGTEPSGR